MSSAIAKWTQALTDLSEDRVTAGAEEVSSWGISHVSRELLRPDVDSAVAATLLAEGVALLVDHGANRDTVLKKLRDDREVWGAWAELRSATIFVQGSDPGTTITLEPSQTKGQPGPDFRFDMPDGSSQLVEFKAVGLSDPEAAFCARMMPEMERLLPKAGLATIHAPLDAPRVVMPKEMRRSMNRRSEALISEIPRYPQGLRGITIVGHRSESEYVMRLKRKLWQAFRQLSEGDECWISFYWSNGATQSDLAAAVDWRDVPERIVGLAFVGSAVAFPHREIHVFHLVMPRGLEPEAAIDVESTLDEDFARLVLGRVEASAGVRPTLLRVGAFELLRRDGARRILPFNLIMDPDPAGVGSRPDRFVHTTLGERAGPPGPQVRPT